ncbi:MAG: hypothetical protein L0Y58_01305 [Verrucomicrobia subdivision 3 bacterium]|nr:hypothetical protein [Limisphaerales bacterium]
MNTNSSAIIVPPPSAAADATNDIRPLKGPVEVPSGLAWLWWVLLLVALVAARKFLRRLIRRLLGQEQVAAPKPVIPPHVRARQKLQAALAHISDPRLFCIEVSDTLRFYLEERFNFRAPERTTEEFLLELRESKRLNDEQKNSLAEFLQSCDLVKFARFEPTEATLRELHESALRLVDETQFDAIQQPAMAATSNVQ